MSSRRPFAASVAALVLILGAVVAAAPVGATSAAAWHETSVHAPIPSGWTSLSCPTATFCIGVAYTQSESSVLETTTNGGRSFVATPAPLAALNPNSVACASRRFCVLTEDADYSGHGSVTLVTTNGGSSWTVVTFPGAARAYDTSLGCSTTACYLVATSSSAAALFRLAVGATHWTAVALPTTPDEATVLSSVGCGGGRCVVAGSTASDTGILFESDGGAFTEADLSGLATAPQYMFSVACSTYACVASGNFDNGFDGVLLDSTASGSWQELTLPEFSAGRQAVCSAVACAVVGGNWDVGGLEAWALAGSTPTWTVLATPAGEGGQVFESGSCLTATTCLVGANRLYSLDPQNGTFVRAHVPDGISGYDMVTCATPRHCVAVGSFGDGRPFSQVSNDGGVHWGAPVAMGNDAAELYNVTCAGLTCLASAFDDVTDIGLFYRSTDAGSTWSVTEVPDLGAFTNFTSVACATGTTCIAALSFDDGDFARTTDGGRTWTTVQPVASPERSGILLTCENTTICVEIADTSKGLERLVSHDAGAHWTPLAPLPKIAANLLQLSCVSAGVCYLAGVLASGKLELLRSVSGGLSWTRVGSPGLVLRGAWTDLSLSCWSATSCEAAGSGATAALDAAVTTDGGRTWTVIHPLGGGVDPQIDCPSSSACLGVGADATARTFTLLEPAP